MRIGEKYSVEEENGDIVIKTNKHIKNPSEYMWGISKKSRKTDAVSLVKKSRNQKMR